MANKRHHRACCEEQTRERFFPVSKIGRLLVCIGLGLAFFSFVFGFWMALLGCTLVLVGFLVIQNC